MDALDKCDVRYYLKCGGGEEREVTQDEFVEAECAAGFHPKPGCGPVATGGFSNGFIKGRIEYN